MQTIENGRAESLGALFLIPKGMSAREFGKIAIGFTLSHSIIEGDDDHNIEIAEILTSHGYSDDEALEFVLNAIAYPIPPNGVMLQGIREDQLARLKR